ncbi:MAG: hypothetical protein ORN56_02000 [Chitinophagales bacterium]|nr:hypothetical protein [Chitinophagales bacterium]
MEQINLGTQIGGEPRNLNFLALAVFTLSAFALGYYLANRQNNKVSILSKEELE